MSVGVSPGDFLTFIKLTKDFIQNSHKACGAHAELTREARSLHAVLQLLKHEIVKPESLLNRGDDYRHEEFRDLCRGCQKLIDGLFQILKKYNALPDRDKSLKKLTHMVRFGNGEMLELHEMRDKISQYTAALNIFLNMLSVGSQGRVESYMVSQGDELKRLRVTVNWMLASMQARTRGENSILTSYADDDKEFWKSLRRELIQEGYPSDVLSKHRNIIKKYVIELGSMGAFDEAPHKDESFRGDIDLYLEEETSQIEPEWEMRLPLTNGHDLPSSDEGGGSTYSNFENEISFKDTKEKPLPPRDTEGSPYTFETDSEDEKTSHGYSIFEEDLPEESSIHKDSPGNFLAHQEGLHDSNQPSGLPNFGHPLDEQISQAGSHAVPGCEPRFWLIPHPEYFEQKIIPITSTRTWPTAIEVSIRDSDLKLLEPFERPIQICGSMLDLKSMCAWMLGNAEIGNQILPSRAVYDDIVDPWSIDLVPPIAELTKVLLEAKTCITRARIAKKYVNRADRETLEDYLLRGRVLLDHVKAYLEKGTWGMLREKYLVRRCRAQTPEEIESAGWVERYQAKDKIRIETYWRREKLENLGRRAGLAFAITIFKESLTVTAASGPVQKCLIVSEIEEFLMFFKNCCESAVERTEATAKYPHSIDLARAGELAWRETVVKEMKQPIEWDVITALLRSYGLSDEQIGAKWTSQLVVSLCKEARARHKDEQAGTIVMEPKTRRYKKRGGSFLGIRGPASKITTTHTVVWDPVDLVLTETSISGASSSRKIN